MENEEIVKQITRLDESIKGLTKEVREFKQERRKVLDDLSDKVNNIDNTLRGEHGDNGFGGRLSRVESGLKDHQDSTKSLWQGIAVIVSLVIASLSFLFRHVG